MPYCQSIKFTGLKIALARQNNLHKNIELGKVKQGGTGSGLWIHTSHVMTA